MHLVQSVDQMSDFHSTITTTVYVTSWLGAM